jgi:hypothetical protein
MTPRAKITRQHKKFANDAKMTDEKTGWSARFMKKNREYFLLKISNKANASKA